MLLKDSINEYKFQIGEVVFVPCNYTTLAFQKLETDSLLKFALNLESLINFSLFTKLN